MMSHKTFNELESLLRDASAQVKLGAEYVHYKDSSHKYFVKGFVILEANDEVAVRYVRTTAPLVEFVRPLKSWLATVVHEGKSVPRFRLV